MPALIEPQSWTSLTSTLIIYGFYCLWVIAQALWSRVFGVRWNDAIPYAVSLLLILAHLFGAITGPLAGGMILAWALIRTALARRKASTPEDVRVVRLGLAAPVFLASELMAATTHAPWVLTNGLKLAAFAILFDAGVEGTEPGTIEPPRGWASGILLAAGVVCAVISLTFNIEAARTATALLAVSAGVIAFGSSPAPIIPSNRKTTHHKPQGRTTFRPEAGR